MQKTVRWICGFFLIGGMVTSTAAFEPVFEAVQGGSDSSCSSDIYTLATVEEAKMYKDSACAALEIWHIARLANGGSIDGSGYDCEIRDKDTRDLGHSLCIRLTCSDEISAQCPADNSDLLMSDPDCCAWYCECGDGIAYKKSVIVVMLLGLMRSNKYVTGQVMSIVDFAASRDASNLW